MRSISCLLLLFFTATSTTLISADAQNAKTTELPAQPINSTDKTAPQATEQPQVNKEVTPVTPYFNDEDEQDGEIKHVEETHFGQLLVKMIVMLACVLIMLYLVAWFAKKFLHTRMQGLNRSSRIQIIESRSLSPKSMIYIIKVDEQEFVISEFHNGMQLIKEISRS